MQNKPKANMAQLREMFDITDDAVDTDVTTKDENGSDKDKSCKIVTVDWRDLRVVDGMWQPYEDETYFCRWSYIDKYERWEWDWIEETWKTLWLIFATRQHAERYKELKELLYEWRPKDGEEKTSFCYYDKWVFTSTWMDEEVGNFHSWMYKWSQDTDEKTSQRILELINLLHAKVSIYNCMVI